MGLFSTIGISSSGLSAQRLKMDVIADNIANAETTRTPEGGVYLRKRVLVRAKTFNPVMQKTNFFPSALSEGLGGGVDVVGIEKDKDAKTILKYDPTHPDAIKSGPKQGYVEMPNVSVVSEMVDLISSSRAYEANIAIINGAKTTFMKALDIGK